MRPDICPMTDRYNFICTVCTTLPGLLDPSHHDEKLGLGGQTSTTHGANGSLIQHSALICHGKPAVSLERW